MSYARIITVNRIKETDDILIELWVWSDQTSFDARQEPILKNDFIIELPPAIITIPIENEDGFFFNQDTQRFESAVDRDGKFRSEVNWATEEVPFDRRAWVYDILRKWVARNSDRSGDLRDFNLRLDNTKVSIKHSDDTIYNMRDTFFETTLLEELKERQIRDGG